MASTFEVEVVEGATFIRLKIGGVKRGGGIRGAVKGLSSGSRKRMMDFFNRLPVEHRARALFVTLTYPGEYSGEWKDWKRDLDAFVKRLQRKWPQSALVWKMEFQRRGAPHFHLVVWRVKHMSKTWLSDAWYNTVKSNDERHRVAGTQVKEVWGGEQALFYLVKYISKKDDAIIQDGTGRVWGVRGRKNLTVICRNESLNSCVFYEVRRVLRAWLERKLGRRIFWARRWSEGITAYMDAETFRAILWGAREKFMLPGHAQHFL